MNPKFPQSQLLNHRHHWRHSYCPIFTAFRTTMRTLFKLLRTPPIVVATLSLVGALSSIAVAAPDTVSLILIDGDMREDWPDHGVVGFHRTETAAPLTVNFALGGTAAAGTDYSVAPAGNTITIPDGRSGSVVGVRALRASA